MVLSFELLLLPSIMLGAEGEVVESVGSIGMASSGVVEFDDDGDAERNQEFNKVLRVRET